MQDERVTEDIVSIELSRTTCWKCGITFALPADFISALRETGQVFFCPNGHPAVFGEQRVHQLEDRLAMSRESEAFWREQHNRAADHAASARRSAAAHKGAHTRTKNRIKNGLCPCCNKQFRDLHKHMKRMHPEFNTEEHGED